MSNLSFANKLTRTSVQLVSAINSHRGKGEQKMTVEHVHIHRGGQAIVGQVGAGVEKNREDQSHALGHAESQALPCKIETIQTALPESSG
jgi:hypothetical protein